MIWIIPIAIVLSLLTDSATSTVIVVTESGEIVSSTAQTGGGIGGALFAATLLMILFRQRYPGWWFDFALALNRFGARVGAYLALLTDQYPSTVDEQSVHLDLDYPDVPVELNRWLPLVKWFLAIPHYIVLFVLFIGAFFAVVIAWFAILFTGRYPRGLFDYVVGVGGVGAPGERLRGTARHRQVPAFQPQVNPRSPRNTWRDPRPRRYHGHAPGALGELRTVAALQTDP